MLSRKQVIDPYAQKEYVKHIIGEMRKEKTPFTVEISGVPIVVHENVFSPKYAEETPFLIEKMASPKGKKVLEIGTGCGAIAVFSAKQGATSVHATDINKSAVANAQENFKNHGCDSPRYMAIQSDLFENINEKYDIVYFNPPWIAGEAENEMELAGLDKDYGTLKRFMAEVGDYLKPDGSVTLGWADCCDMGLLNDLIKENGYEMQKFYENPSRMASYCICVDFKEKQELKDSNCRYYAINIIVL